MRLSNCGRIVLIDDKHEEVKPLLEALSLHGLPYLYYDGTLEKFPETPPGGVRFLFLDIVLQGMDGQDDKTKASGLTGRILKVISTTNGPYVIIFWTKHIEVIDQVIENCRTKSIAPVSWLDMEKSDCINEHGDYDIKNIVGKLDEELLKIGAFRLYVEWENTLGTATKQFVQNFSSLVKLDDNWSKNTSSLFYKLYKSYVDKNDLEDRAEQFKCASHIMNLSFFDTLQNETLKNLTLPDEFRLENGTIDKETIAKLNTSLSLSEIFLDQPYTGYVYIDKNETLKKTLEQGLFKENQAPLESKLCKIIITPECDLAQNKTLRTERTIDGDIKKYKIHSIVYGLMSPKTDDFDNKRKKNNSQFEIGEIWYDDKRQCILIHFSTVSFGDEETFSSRPVFSLKRDLVFDLQSKAANHVNRLGNFQLR